MCLRCSSCCVFVMIVCSFFVVVGVLVVMCLMVVGELKKLFGEGVFVFVDFEVYCVIYDDVKVIVKKFVGMWWFEFNGVVLDFDDMVVCG